jgi:hypothetical protein
MTDWERAMRVDARDLESVRRRDLNSAAPLNMFWENPLNVGGCREVSVI